MAMKLLIVLLVNVLAVNAQCSDKSSNCAGWKAYCNDAQYKAYMKENCPSTCSYCSPPPAPGGPPTQAPPLCADKEDCAGWVKGGYCTGQFQPFMKDKCAKSCGFCIGLEIPTTQAPVPTTSLPADCQDKSSYCGSYKDYCTDKDYVDYLQKECKRTCNYCHITTAAPAPTTTPPPYTGPGGRDVYPSCGRRVGTSTRIVGGTQAKAGDWPWQVNFDYKYNTGNPGHHCGGTLITNEWVVSAAHCFVNDMTKEYYWLKMGEHDIKNSSIWEQRFEIDQLILHPKYDADTQDFDLALIKLKKPAFLNARVQPACLPGGKTSFPIGKKCWITGWGLLEEYGNGAAILQQAQVPLIDRDVCQKAFDHLGYGVSHQMLCAGYVKGGIDSCEGDSGGPLVCEQTDPVTGKDTWFLWGAISWGVGCARSGMYGVLANIKQLRPWIDQVVFNN